MGRKSNDLSESVIAFIEENHRILSVREIATARKVSYQAVYSYMHRNGLPMILTRLKKAGTKKPVQRHSQFFNPRAEANWLV